MITHRICNSSTNSSEAANKGRNNGDERLKGWIDEEELSSLQSERPTNNEKSQGGVFVWWVFNLNDRRRRNLEEEKERCGEDDFRRLRLSDDRDEFMLSDACRQDKMMRGEMREWEESERLRGELRGMRMRENSEIRESKKWGSKNPNCHTCIEIIVYCCGFLGTEAIGSNIIKKN